MAALSGVALDGLAAPPAAEPAKAEAKRDAAAGGKADRPEAKKAGAAEATPEKPAPARPAAASSSKAGAKRVAAKTPAKPAARSKAPKKGAAKITRKPGEPGAPDEAARRVIAGTATPAGASVAESPELRTMREIDLALFPGATPSAGPAWPVDGTLLLGGGEPRLEASGLPPAGLPVPPPQAEETRDISWLRQLELPEIPVRWDGRVVRYLEYYKDDPRGRSAVVSWIKKSGRYGAAIRRVLREQGLPEDLLWLSLVESGFDPTIHSPAGAAGLWQFMPEGARIYGLTVDRWVDERLDPERSTLAAARYLSDLRRRFGGWELAFAAYNMGYGGLLASIRKYNTNDFWELSRLEAGMPLETALYVPKILAIAIVARNLKVFGCDEVELDPAVTFDKISLGSGVSLQSVASAVGAGAPEIEALNPQLVAKRTPPLPVDAKELARWEVRVPAGAGARAAKAMPKLLEREPKLERYLVRWGESLDDIATFRGTTRWTLQTLNGLRPGEPVRPGTLLFVPAAEGVGVAAAEHLLANGAPLSSAAKPVVVVPAQRFSYEGRRRVFYRVVAGDAIRDLAAVLSVTPDEICRWNTLSPGASLHEGMTLQLFVPRSQRYDGVFLLDEADARILPVGSEEFFAHFEGLKGRKRIEIAVREGDTFSNLASRYGLSVGSLERINQRSRRSPLMPGDRLVVYVPTSLPDDPPPVEPREPREDEVRVASAPAAGAVDDGDKAAAAVKPATAAAPAGEEGRKAAVAKDGSSAPAGAAAAAGETKPARAEKAEAGETKPARAAEKAEAGETKPARAAEKAEAGETKLARAEKAEAGETKPARAEKAEAGETKPARAEKAEAGETKPARAEKAEAGETKPAKSEGAAGAGDQAGAAPEEKKTADGEKKPAPGGADEKKPAGRAKGAQEKPAAGAGTAL
ncbi:MULTISPECIES: transglycosylase SLT domain-containing protein [Sorangium]|uniref:Murein transglycosylase n=1 Tax=Sorangium cellulosum TaxID=56 RepID=A0A4P2QJ86_SORCE|nr:MULTISPECIES: transglycosylase SLT domain-containing protein [Sorangium]AUX30010.1 murein transglycosylase [Sorangium cellulosum]WCQ89400.1 lytic tail protein [Sorangium sp. Soce836]